MRAAAITGKGAVEIVDRPQPHGLVDLVVVQILVAPMCTEFKSRQAGDVSDSIGHEAAGVVVDAGSSTRVAVGDRVVVMPGYACGTCRYCIAGEHIHCPFQRDVLAESEQPYGTATYAEYVLKPDWLLVPVPDDVSLVHASAACCLLGPSFNASQRMNVAASDTLLVAGCGPVGLGAIINGVTRNATVLALEVNPWRADLARQLGATVFDPTAPDIVDQVLDATDGWGVTASIETSGVPSNPALLASVSARRAGLSIVAWGLDITLPPIVPLGLDVHGVWHWKHQTDGWRMIETIRKASGLIDTAITHRFPLDRVSEAMDVQDSGRCGKVLLFPTEVQDL
ncbi:zinc-binding dehydrogenase [Leifsonia sp. fls2-241-R2A-40a]|uniref:zinc-dependent alcohol dehydrogenase n=1 Tax=Leifsonia sp. fls2-241-R2A-40a TaxID=3040290 RepID=UPI00254C82E7|nr:zinc-binding dehydrogenase [Leifsonia sp. fls2-241-R2A-40a]